MTFFQLTRVGKEDGCYELRQTLRHYWYEMLPSRFECSLAPQKGVRVRTPLMYPDGGIVDVFVLERGNGYIVTDFGDALGWLSMQSVNAQPSLTTEFDD